LIHGWTRLFGFNEISLRSFSLCTFVIACVFLYLILRKKYSPEIAILGTIFPWAILLNYVTYLDARPYCLAIAFSVASYYFFFLWIEGGGPKTRVLQIVCAVATIYAHWLYGTLLLVQTLLIFLLKLPDRRSYYHQWLMNIFIIGALCSPNLYHFVLVFKDRFTFNYLSPPNLRTLLHVTFPLGGTLLILIASCLLIISYLIIKRQLFLFNNNFKTLIIGIVLLVIPTFILFAFSLLFDVSLLSYRYNGASYISLGLISASLFSCLPMSSFRSILMFMISVYIIFSMDATVISEKSYFLASWRESSAFLGKLQKENVRPIMLSSTLIESCSKEWIKDPSKRDYLLAPVQYYLPSQDAIPIPNIECLSLLNEVLTDNYVIDTLHKNGFYLLIYAPEERWRFFENYFSERGFFLSLEKEFTGIYVLEFKPRSS
jgi:hypothetical protein